MSLIQQLLSVVLALVALVSTYAVGSSVVDTTALTDTATQAQSATTTTASTTSAATNTAVTTMPATSVSPVSTTVTAADTPANGSGLAVTGATSIGTGSVTDATAGAIVDAAADTSSVVVQGGTVSLRYYRIGNSLSEGYDSKHYRGIHALAEAAGKGSDPGFHIIWGAPLQWIWEHPEGGFADQVMGKYQKAFSGTAIDAVVLQPYHRPLDNTIEFAQKFMDAALANNPDVQMYIFAHYPHNKGSDWEGQWLSGTGTNTSRAFFEAVADAMTAAHPNAKPVRIVPVGEVMYDLKQKIDAGQVPGVNSIWDLYADDVHLDQEPQYITAVVHYATLYCADPRGLPTGEYLVSAAYAEAVQQSAYDVVLGSYSRACGTF